MTVLLTIVHVFVCIFLVAVVLLQSGRAGGMGVLSGAATQTVFGGRGATGFLAKATTICATLFMLTSASLAYTSTSAHDPLARQRRREGSTPVTAPTKNANNPGRQTTPPTNVTPPTPAPAPTAAGDAAPAATGDAARAATGAAAGDASAAPTAP